MSKPRFVFGETVRFKRDGLRGAIAGLVNEAPPRYYVQTTRWTFSAHENELLPVAPGERWKGDPTKMTPIRSNVEETAGVEPAINDRNETGEGALAGSPSPTSVEAK
jgi:hypothetical protein